MESRLELVDTSAWARRRDPAVHSWFRRATSAGQVTLCDLVVLELLRYVAARDYETIAESLRGLHPVKMTESDWAEAARVQRELARQTAQDHRKVKIADLLIASAAVRTGLPLLHYDDDFDRIQKVTGQPMRWLAPRGSLGVSDR